jgi:hypothetical protein
MNPAADRLGGRVGATVLDVGETLVDEAPGRLGASGRVSGQAG